MGWRDRRNERLLARYVQQREAHINRMRTPRHLLDPLVRELVEIGERDGFLGNERKRVRQIGMVLNQRGGMRAMRVAHEDVSYWLPRSARELEMAWDHIGEWLG